VLWNSSYNLLLDHNEEQTLRGALEKGLEFESKAVENYHNIAKKALESNNLVTYRVATTILADEVKDEQRTEDILKNLEVD
jgi:ferritin